MPSSLRHQHQSQGGPGCCRPRRWDRHSAAPTAVRCPRWFRGCPAPGGTASTPVPSRKHLPGSARFDVVPAPRGTEPEQTALGGLRLPRTRADSRHSSFPAARRTPALPAALPSCRPRRSTGAQPGTGCGTLMGMQLSGMPGYGAPGCGVQWLGAACWSPRVLSSLVKPVAPCGLCTVRAEPVAPTGGAGAGAGVGHSC